MKHLGWLLILLCSAVQADIFTWVDADGRVHYGDRPPADTPVRQLDPGQGNVSMIGGSELRQSEWDSLERFEQRQSAPEVVVPAPIIVANPIVPSPVPVRQTRIVTRYPFHYRHHPPKRTSGLRLELGGDRWRLRLHSGDRFPHHPHQRRYHHQHPAHRPVRERNTEIREPSAARSPSRVQSARLPR